MAARFARVNRVKYQTLRDLNRQNANTGGREAAYLAMPKWQSWRSWSESATRQNAILPTHKMWFHFQPSDSAERQLRFFQRFGYPPLRSERGRIGIQNLPNPFQTVVVSDHGAEQMGVGNNTNVFQTKFFPSSDRTQNLANSSFKRLQSLGISTEHATREPNQ